MANAKLPRSRLRRRHPVRGSNPRSRTKQNIPPELRAPITSEVQRQLKQLVAQFREKQVLDALAPLITRCKWNDWQCVANAIRRIARKNCRMKNWLYGHSVSAVDSKGRTIWIADAHCGDGKRFVVRADEKLIAFLELEISGLQT